MDAGSKDVLAVSRLGWHRNPDDLKKKTRTTQMNANKR